MKTTRLEIAAKECEPHPPGLHPENEGSPTPEEVREHAELCRRWEAAGGLDRHYFRVSLTIGPSTSFGAYQPEKLQRMVIESPFFHKDDAAGRAHAEAATRDMIEHSVSAKLRTLLLT